MSRFEQNRVAKPAVAPLFLRHHGLFAVQVGEGLAFLSQSLQYWGRFPELAVLLMKF